jgi:hypothetical protein
MTFVSLMNLRTSEESLNIDIERDSKRRGTG